MRITQKIVEHNLIYTKKMIECLVRTCHREILVLHPSLLYPATGHHRHFVLVLLLRILLCHSY